MDRDILLTGATGNTGQFIVQELKQRGVPFKALARSEKRRTELAAAGIPTVAGDFNDPASLEAALSGVAVAYLVCTPDERLIPCEIALITAAQKAGVRHIVKCSAYMAGREAPSANLRAHGAIEQALITSGLEYTIIRPHGFMQTFTLFAWDMIQKAHVISLPAGEGKIPLVDMRDVAQVVVKALTESGHIGKIYDVTGPEALNGYQQAAILQRVLGHPVTYLPGSERQLTFGMKILGVPAVPAEHVSKAFQMQREHCFERVHPTLQELGIQPTTYEQFLRDFIAGRAGSGNSFAPPDTLLVRMMNATMPLMMRLQLRFNRRAIQPQP